MVTIQKYEQILGSGLLLDHYHVILAISKGEELPTNRRVKGFLNLLEKKGYIQDGVLTEMCDQLIEEIHTTITTCTTTTTLKPKEAEIIDFPAWVASLHEKCQKRMIQLTGTKQIRGKIQGKSYPFLPNVTDLGRVLVRAINSYKLTDYDKIEKTILGHIDACHKANSFFPLINYYIMKGNYSEMVTDMESAKEQVNDDPIVNI